MAAVDSFALLFKPFERRLGNFRDALAVVGIAYSAYVGVRVTFRVLRLLKDGVSRMAVGWSEPQYVKRYGDWAVIVGGIGGLGAAFAAHYAAAGMNVLLLSRDETKLRRVQQQLKQQFNVEVDYLAWNFAEQDETDELYSTITNKLLDKDVGILVNNVSYMPPDPTEFASHTWIQLSELITANIVSVTLLTHLVLPGMIKRRRGEVINVGSCLCTHPTPLLSMFCASKSFVEYLSRALNEEVRGKNVRVRCLTPLCVARDGLRTSNSSASLQQLAGGNSRPPVPEPPRGWLVPAAEKYVTAATQFLEASSVCSTTGYVPHEFLRWLFGHMSSHLWSRISFGVNQGFRQIRQRRKSSTAVRTHQD